MKADDCIGPEVEKLVNSLPDGGVLLIENVRFYKEEEKNEPEFAKKLASLADLYVNDAFGTAHRAHASTEGVTKFLKPSVAGFLLQKVGFSVLTVFGNADGILIVWTVIQSSLEYLFLSMHDLIYFFVNPNYNQF